MIRPVNTVIDESLFNPAFVDDVPGNKKIIDAPPDIAISCFKPVRPPRVFYGIRVKIAKGVGVSVFSDAIEPVALYA
jgi:hypothetical protein